MQVTTRTLLYAVLASALILFLTEIGLHRATVAAIDAHDGHVASALAAHDGHVTGR